MASLEEISVSRETVGGTFKEVSFKDAWPILMKFEADYKSYEEEFAPLVALLSSQLR